MYANKTTLLAVASGLIVGVVPALCLAIPGELDPTFGTGGLVTTDIDASSSFDLALALAVQADGKIIAAGRSLTGSSFDFDLANFGLARYNTDGTLDITWGGSGTSQWDFGLAGGQDLA